MPLAARQRHDRPRPKYRPLSDLPDRPLAAMPHGLVHDDDELAARLQAAAALHLAHLARDRLDRRPINHATGTYNNVIRKPMMTTGQAIGRLQWRDAAQACYGAVGADEARAKREALRIDFKRLQAAGVIRFTEERGPDGESRGIVWEASNRPPEPALWPDLRYSARRYPARQPSPAELEERQLARCELAPPDTHAKDPRRRTHPHNRRVGRRSAHRYAIRPATPAPRRSSTHSGLSGPPLDDRPSLRSGRSSFEVQESERTCSSPDEAQLCARNDLSDGPTGAPTLSPDAEGPIDRLRTAGTEDGGRDRERQVRDRWQRLEAFRELELRRLAAIRRPAYMDLAEAFFLTVALGAGEDWRHDVGGLGRRHARATTRLALEREAARYDRYAERLLIDGQALEHLTSTALCVAWWSSRPWPGVLDLASPGSVLRQLGFRARELRARWRALHADERDRRAHDRRARRVRELADDVHAGRGRHWIERSPRWDWLATIESDWRRLELSRVERLRYAAVALAIAEGWRPTQRPLKPHPAARNRR